MLDIKEIFTFKIQYQASSIQYPETSIQYQLNHGSWDKIHK